MAFCLRPWSAALPSPLPLFSPEQIGFLGTCDLCFVRDVGVCVRVCGGEVRGGACTADAQRKKYGEAAPVRLFCPPKCVCIISLPSLLPP